VLPFVVCGVGEEGKRKRKRDLVISILPIASEWKWRGWRMRSDMHFGGESME